MEAPVSCDVQIVLNIKEGTGFDQILLPTLIVATLNGHSLETDRIEPSPNPQYGYDLVWEVDKNKLKKMRSAQVPLKLECFVIKTSDYKEKFGFLLLNLRSALVLLKNNTTDIKHDWYQLVGVKGEFKKDKPKLLIALSIRYPELTMPNSQLELKDSEGYQETALESPRIAPILLPNECLIQLGPLNACHELFLMNITAVSATNVDSLLPTNCYRDVTNNLYFWCKILENDVHFNQCKEHYGELWTLNEKIVIRIRSSIKILKDYLKLKPFMFIHLKHEQNIIGQSKVNLKPLVPTDNIYEFMKIGGNGSITLNQRCYLYKRNKSGDAECENSYIDLQLKLQYVGNEGELVTDTPSTVNDDLGIPTKKSQIHLKQTTSPINEIDNHRNPAGDFEKYVGAKQYKLYNNHNNIDKPTSSYKLSKTQPVESICLQLADTVQPQSNINDYCKGVETYHGYCLNIRLIAIKVTSPTLAIGGAEIRLHHPKTEVASTFYPNVPFTLGETIKLQNMGCKLHFVSAIDEIKQLLFSFPPKISIYKNEENCKICISHSVVDVKQLFLQNKTEYLCNVPLCDMEQNNVGNLDLLLNLQDNGPYYKVNRLAQSEYLGPPILDDSLAYKIVDELETWKERQMEIFKAELKRKEDRHLNLLSHEWQIQKEGLETKLAFSVEQCRILTNSLNNATEDLRMRRIQSFEREAKLRTANKDLQQSYELRMWQLKEWSRTMQEELASKIEILEKKKTILEGQVEHLTTENERLQLLVTRQLEELEIYQKGSLTQDQTANLLQELKILEEKLQSAQDNKAFFKAQWAKAVREIHCMRKEYQEARQVQIKNSKEELQNLDLEEILCTDSNALLNDKILLDEIQKEIDVIKPKSSFTDRSVYCQVFTPTSFDSKNLPNKSTLKRSDECNERLQALVEERDSLLKTGSYTIDDTVIKKLNTEIRSLMMK